MMELSPEDPPPMLNIDELPNTKHGPPLAAAGRMAAANSGSRSVPGVTTGVYR
jgi:hypothetical protein